MKVRTLWVDYSGYPGELAPNIMLAVDEYLEEENPSVWDEEVARLEDDGVLEYPHREVVLEVPGNVIRDAFDPVQTEARVVES